MLWLDDPSTDQEGQRRKRSLHSTSSIQFFPAHQLRIKQRIKRRRQRPAAFESCESTINPPTINQSLTLTSSSSSCSFNASQRMNRSFSSTGSIASSTCLSSASSTTRRLPREYSIKQPINQSNQRFVNHSRSIACLESRHSIDVLDDDQSTNQTNDHSCDLPTELDQLHYLSDPESQPFFNQHIAHSINQKPLLFVPTAKQLIVNESTNQTNDRPYPHVTIDIPNDEVSITIQTSPINAHTPQCYHAANQLMSPPNHVEISTLPLLAPSPVNMFSGMQFTASTAFNAQLICQQLSPRSFAGDDEEGCSTMIGAGCLCLVIGLVVLIASLYFVPLLQVSAFIHTVSFIMPLSTIVLAFYACVSVDRSSKPFHTNLWLCLGTVNLLSYMGFAFHCILPLTLSSSSALDYEAVNASFALGVIVLLCAAMLGLVLARVLHWKDCQCENSQLYRSTQRVLKRPPVKSMKLCASLEDMSALLIERTRLRKLRRSVAKSNGVLRSKDELVHDSEQSSFSD